MDKAAVSVHLDTGKGYDSNHIVHEANEKLKHIHGIKFITIQVCYLFLNKCSPVLLQACNDYETAATVWYHLPRRARSYALI